MGNEIVKHIDATPTTALAAITPRSYDDVSKLAVAVAKSGLYNVRGPDDAFVRIITGIELGISPMQSLRTIAVVSGKPVLDAALIAALCMRHPECEYWRVVETTDTKAVIETKHRRNGVTRLGYSIEQAKLAGLAGKDNWKHYPAAMLRARCTSALARIAYPEVVAGVYVPDELEPAGAAHETVVESDFADDRISSPGAADSPWLDRIAAAQTDADLRALGREIRDANLDKAERAMVRDAYADRQREIRARRPSSPQATQSVASVEPEVVDEATGEVA